MIDITFPPIVFSPPGVINPLEQAINYVKNQKHHHSQGTTNHHLEKIEIV